MNQQTDVVELGKRIIAQIAEFRRCALKPITSERTDNQGQIILALSSILILVFAGTITINSQELLGTKIDFTKGKEPVFLIILIIVCVYFSALYITNLWLDRKNWQIDYSQEKEKVNTMIKELQSLSDEGGQRLYAALENDLPISNLVEELKKFKTVDKAVDYYMNGVLRERTIAYRIKIFLFGFVPIVFAATMVIIAILHYLKMI